MFSTLFLIAGIYLTANLKRKKRMNKFNLPDGLLRLVFLLMVHSYLIVIINQQNADPFLQKQFFHCFKWNTNQLLLLNIFSFLFLQTFLLINLISFCFDPWIFSYLLANLNPSDWLFLVFFRFFECLFPKQAGPCAARIENENVRNNVCRNIFWCAQWMSQILIKYFLGN